MYSNILQGEDSMQSKFFYIIAVLSLFLRFKSVSQETETTIVADKRVEDFEKIVDRVSSFFHSNPVFLDEQQFPKSPTKKVFQSYKHLLLDLSYDVKKTTSLITPLTGIIMVQCKVLLNTRGKAEYFDDVLEERMHITSQSCMQDTIFGNPRFSSGGEFSRLAEFEITYGYQKN